MLENFTHLLESHYIQVSLGLAVILPLILLVLLFHNLRNLSRLGQDAASKKVELEHLSQSYDLLQHDYQKALERLERSSAEQKQLETQCFQLEKQIATERVRHEERFKALEQSFAFDQSAKHNLLKEFESLANKVLEAKQLQFDRITKDQWLALIAPFKEQIHQYNQRVEDVHKIDSAQRNQLLGQILELQKQSQLVSKEAFNLSNVLRGNNKSQGVWGELVLEQVLQQSGLQRGREYDIQVSHASAEGRRLQPDAVIHLPESRDIVVDSKVSLVAYERLVSAVEESDIESAKKQLIDSFRAHIKSLSGKSYNDLLGTKSLDFVLMFVPVEAALSQLVQSAPDLLSEAYSKRIALVSPSSLMVVLKTVESLWSRQRQDENVARIVDSAGKLYDQFVLLLEAMTDIGTSLQKAETSFVTAKKRLSDGRGNLIVRMEQLRNLGAKTSKLVPEQWLESASDSEDTSAHSEETKGDPSV